MNVHKQCEDSDSRPLSVVTHLYWIMFYKRRSKSPQSDIFLLHAHLLDHQRYLSGDGEVYPPVHWICIRRSVKLGDFHPGLSSENIVFFSSSSKVCFRLSVLLGRRLR